MNKEGSGGRVNPVNDVFSVFPSVQGPENMNGSTQRFPGIRPGLAGVRRRDGDVAAVASKYGGPGELAGGIGGGTVVLRAGQRQRRTRGGADGALVNLGEGQVGVHVIPARGDRIEIGRA